ncbi:hypothetical protein M9H77_34351 [Catharanthus roseus]|uniref:Uncharacterized protein n=1 Tax=Catharanthus roseus TaxID=4058 RepID=A0ACB9ZM54_CATRO|nr:hypothetical protein M9H77_34351 [Catharanthus roseus]
MYSSKSISLITVIRIMLKSSSMRREVTIYPLSMRSDVSSNVALISMLHKKLVQKALRSLLARFRPKVAAIEEANDVTKLSFDDLLGFLRTYEKNLDTLGSFFHRTGRTSEPQERFKTDNKDRRGPNMFKSKGSTMKQKFDTECERYGHIKVECANTLKKNRSMNTILGDDDIKSDTEDD